MTSRRVRLVLALGLALCSFVHASTLAAADAASPWTAGPNAIGDDTYSGFIDLPVSGSTVIHNSTVTLKGWVVDRSAVGWTGIDDVEVYLGLQDQGGTLIVRAGIDQPRDDVARALGNPFWGNAGFSASFADSGLAAGSNLLTVYAHTPDKGWWYKQVFVRGQTAPSLAYADDPLLIIRSVSPSLDVAQTTQAMTLDGYAIDRNLPSGSVLGVGGSGVRQVQLYLDGPRQGGVYLGSAQLGLKNREATGFGQRFLDSGWELIVHPNEFSVDRHEFYIYAASAYWPNESLVIVPFNVH